MKSLRSTQGTRSAWCCARTEFPWIVRRKSLTSDAQLAFNVAQRTGHRRRGGHHVAMRSDSCPACSPLKEARRQFIYFFSV